MDNEMIDRVIKASFDCWNGRRGLNYTVDDLSDSEKEFARMHALAIIKAMREPTEKMVLGADLYSSAEDSIGIYQAIIDAVIND